MRAHLVRGSTIALALCASVASLEAQVSSVTRPLPASAAALVKRAAPALPSGTSFSARTPGSTLDRDQLFTFDAPVEAASLAASENEEEEEEEASAGWMPGGLGFGSGNGAAVRATSAGGNAGWASSIAALSNRVRKIQRLLNGAERKLARASKLAAQLETSGSPAVEQELRLAYERLGQAGWLGPNWRANMPGRGVGADVGSAIGEGTVGRTPSANDFYQEPTATDSPNTGIGSGGAVDFGSDPLVTVNPEPGTIALLGGGLLLIGGYTRRRRLTA